MRHIRLMFLTPVVYFLFWVNQTTGANVGGIVNHLKTVTLETQTIPGITFFADTKKVAVVDSWARALLVWDTSTWEMIAKIVEQSGFPRSAVSSQDGQLLAVLKRPGKGTRIEIYIGAAMAPAGVIEEEND